MQTKPDVINLFSGGLDSLMAAKVLEQQGLRVLNIHFTTPFFGKAHKIPHWQDIYGLDIEEYDASLPFVTMLANWPAHGTGKTLNPCVDCKIILLRLAAEIMRQRGAKFLSTGEVIGQRPMSQRTDTLNIISRESGTRDLLLRPLCARHLPETPMERQGLVQRDQLLDFNGRNRLPQLGLAAALGISEIPAPGGGCKLTERENARRYWTVLTRHWLAASDMAQLVQDFHIANLGRMIVNREDNSFHWLAIGRNASDNARLVETRQPGDLMLKLPFPGPVALARQGRQWSNDRLREACDILAGYAPRSRLERDSTQVLVYDGMQRGELAASVNLHKDTWRLPSWDSAHEEIKAVRKQKQTASKSASVPDTREA